MRGFGLALPVAALVAAWSVASNASDDAKPHIDTSGVNMQPAYPASAYGTGERGSVVLGVAVSAAGSVEKIRLVQASGFNDIDAAAIAGVMGWKFIPATHDGSAVEGIATVKLIFEPPDAQSAPGAAPTADPATVNYLASSFDLEAERGKFSSLDKPLPCPNGRVDVTLQFLHTNGAAALPGSMQSLAFMALEVRSPKDGASVFMVDHEYYKTPIEKFGFQRNFSDAQSPSWLAYSYFGRFGTRETVSIFWNADGLVTGEVGNRETHQTQLPVQPTILRFTASSVVARFTGAELICYPTAKWDSG